MFYIFCINDVFRQVKQIPFVIKKRRIKHLVLRFTINLLYKFTEMLGIDSDSIPYRCMYSTRAFTLKSHLDLGLHYLKCPHKVKLCSGTSAWPDKKLKNSYTRLKTGIERRSSDVAGHMDGSFGLTAETLTIIKKHEGGVFARNFQAL